MGLSFSTVTELHLKAVLLPHRGARVTLLFKASKSVTGKQLKSTKYHKIFSRGGAGVVLYPLVYR